MRRQTTVRALVTLRDSKGDSVCTRNLPITLFPGENPSLTWNLYLRNGTLWSPDSPYLYTCTVELWQEEILLDSIQETFGLRHIQFDPVQGMRLNNHPIHLRGCCIHEDNGILGTADFASAVERKVRLLKEAGFNALRIAHQPATKNLLNCCDKVGMFLLEESFDAWTHTKNVHDRGEHFSDQWLQVVDRIVAKDFNHPCVFAYSIGNEILEISQPDGIRYSRLLAQRFREKDPTRPVTNAINGIMSLRNSLADVLLDLKLITSDQLAALGESKKPGSPSIDINDTMTILQSSMDLIASHPLVGQLLEESFSHLDLCGYNYMMGRYDSDLATDSHRILLGSETTPPQIARLWENTQRSPGCLGDFTWTGWDYLGEAGVGYTAYDRKKDFGEPYPTYLAAVGDIDLTGHRLPMSYYREIVFGLRNTPYLSVENPAHFSQTASCTPWAFPETVESWTWPGWEGAPVRLIVCAAGDEIALLCNGEEVGRTACGPETGYRAQLETVYHPGQLTVVSYSNGMETGRFTLETAENTCQLRTAIDTAVLQADGSDLCFLEIQVTDSHGVVHSDKNPRITLQTEGGIIIQGFGTGDPSSEENFFDTTRTAYRGRALAALRGNSPGSANVVVSCPDCAPITVNLEVVSS